MNNFKWPPVNSGGVHSDAHKEVCGMIDGLLEIDDGSKGKCPKCSGEGRVSRYEDKSEWQVFYDKEIIVGLEMDIYGFVEWRVCPTYCEDKDKFVRYEESVIFASREEAQKQCDKNNKDITRCQKK